MHYEVNVSRNGIHVFATHERSLVSLEKARAVRDLLREKFPQSEGYEVQLYRKEVLIHDQQ